MYYVYCHTNKINNKKYIGITKQIPENRWGKDGINYKSSPHFYASICKYGWDNFQHDILYDNLTKEEACNIEKELIKLYKTQDKNYGYNVLEGGEAPSIPMEIREKMSSSMIGNQNGKGKKCSPEKRRKISEAQKGKKLTDEHKEKLSQAAKKRHVPCSQEKKEKLSQNYPNKKRVYCHENGIVYDSIHQCARELNLHATSIVKVCKGKKHSTGGYHFSYYND